MTFTKTEPKKSRDKRSIIFSELSYLKKPLIIAVVFTLLSAVLQGIGLGLILTFLQNIIEPNSEPIQTGITWIDIHILGNGFSPINRIYRTSGVVIVTIIVQSLCTGLGVTFSGYVQSQLAYRLQLRLFDQLAAVKVDYFSKTRTGKLINGLTTEVNELKRVFEVITFIFVRGTILGVYIISMFLISWQLTLLIVGIFSLISALISKLFLKLRKVSVLMTKARGWYTSVAIEFINGIRTVHAAAAKEYERGRFKDATLDVLEEDKKSWRIRGLIEPIPEAFMTLIALGILLFAFTVLVPSGGLRVSSLLTFLFIIIRTLPIVRQLNNARGNLSKHQGAVHEVSQLLETANKPYFSNGPLDYQELKESITFNAVSFGYDTENLVVNGVDLELKQGETTALVGASGAGKTTLAELIPRFNDPTSGSIYLDSTDLRDLDVYSLRRKMAIVSQDTFIFNASVRDNISYALGSVDESKVIEAARKARAWDFICELPDGLETNLGDRGVLLSGGQRQRIAIARALLRDPDILILDEATSALDSVTERLIQKSIEELSEGRTVIAIAHRLSTIARADKVVVLEKGQVVEQGKFQELLDKKGQLWKYYQMQNKVG